MARTVMAILVTLDEKIYDDGAKQIADHLLCLRGVTHVELVESPGVFEEQAVRNQERRKFSELVTDLHSKIWEKA